MPGDRVLQTKRRSVQEVEEGTCVQACRLRQGDALAAKPYPGPRPESQERHPEAKEKVQPALRLSAPSNPFLLFSISNMPDLDDAGGVQLPQLGGDALTAPSGSSHTVSLLIGMRFSSSCPLSEGPDQPASSNGYSCSWGILWGLCPRAWPIRGRSVNMSRSWPCSHLRLHF